MLKQTKKPLILAVTGSTRAGSTNHKIIWWLKNNFASAATISLFEAAVTLPPFQPGLDDNEVPAAVRDWLLQIEKADGILFATPEYVFSLPGMLKNALEWTVASTVFSDKPVAFIVAAADGGHAMASLSLILQTLTGQAVPLAHQLLIRGVQGKMNDNNGFTDADTEKAVHSLMQTFLVSLNKL